MDAHIATINWRLKTRNYNIITTKHIINVKNSTLTREIKIIYISRTIKIAKSIKLKGIFPLILSIFLLDIRFHDHQLKQMSAVCWFVST